MMRKCITTLLDTLVISEDAENIKKIAKNWIGRMGFKLGPVFKYIIFV